MSAAPALLRLGLWPWRVARHSPDPLLLSVLTVRSGVLLIVMMRDAADLLLRTNSVRSMSTALGYLEGQNIAYVPIWR